MATGKLTDRHLKAWHTLGSPIPAQADGGGLYFRIHQSGMPQWYFRYQLAGRQRWMFLGNYPDVSLADARKMARAARVQLDRGEDVAALRQQQRAERQRAYTAADLADEWYAREVEPLVKHPEIGRRILDKYVLPKIGKLPAASVLPRDADAVLSAIAKHAPTTANDALRHMRKMFAYGRKRRYVELSPVADFELADAGGKETPRQRALSPDELAALLKAMRETPVLGRVNELTFKLLLALCVRKGELVAARWDEFDLDAGVWRLPASRTKTGAALEIPLAPQVVEWLQELRVFAAGSEYLLPARRIAAGQRFPHISPDTLNVALGRVRHGLEHFTIHDMRRTARTQLAALGVSREVAERALNHKLRGVEGIYNRHDYLEERKAALAQWADLLVRLERGAGKVVPIRLRA